MDLPTKVTRAAALAWARQHTDRLDARLLLEYAAQCRQSALIADPDVLLSPQQWAVYQALVERRVAGEPLAYLTGEAGFYGERFVVTPDVLVPRPETEELVAWALEILGDFAAPTIVDMGTGSGAIALTLARARPEARVIGVDVSAAALAVATRNQQCLAVENVVWRCASWFKGWTEPTGLDLVISNPPYIPADDAHLTGDGVCFEPRLALTDEADGLDAYRDMIPDALRYLQPGGWLLLEHGHDQAGAVAALCQQAGGVQICGRRDLSGNPRMTAARKPQDGQ